MYRWVNIFARPVPVYALVDGYVGECAYVYVCVYAPVHEYDAVAVYVCVHPSIHPYIYAPEQKIEIENRDHP